MPKKQPFKKITNRELDIMQLLWNAEKPLIASEIASLKPDLTINTVQAVLRKLLKQGYIEIAEIVYSGTVLTRSYRPLISEQDFGADQLLETFRSFPDLSISRLVAGLLNENISLEEITELEAMLEKQKEILKNQSPEKEIH